MTERVDKTWSRWGAELKSVRRSTGKTQTELSRATRISRPHIGKLENGTRTPNRDHAVVLDGTLATDGKLLRLWEELNDVIRVPEEWQDFVQIERSSVEIREYQPLLISGLLQAPGYARATLSSGYLNETPDLLEQAVKTRVDRLTEIPPRVQLRFVLDETVLRRRVGPPEVMREQLDHLLSLIQDGRIRLSIVPDHIPRQTVVGGSFRIFGLPGGGVVIHLEHARGQVVLDDPQAVNEMATTYGDLQAEALPPYTTAELIEKVRGEL